VWLVAGVFLGIQAANWKEERADRSAEVRHLEEIAEDLRADIAVFDQIRTSARARIDSIDHVLGESRGKTRQTSLQMPTGEVFDIPEGRPIPVADRGRLLSRVNLVRTTTGNRTGFEALIGAGGMQTLRNRAISRQLQVYYARMDDLVSTQNMLRQIRIDGTQVGYPLGLSAFGDMEEDKLITIVRGSTAYSAYLRTVREWAAIHLATVAQQKELALKLLDDINT